MSANRNPPETPEGVAWGLFQEIRRAEEKEGQARRHNASERARLLELFHEFLMGARGDRPEPGFGASVH